MRSLLILLLSATPCFAQVTVMSPGGAVNGTQSMTFCPVPGITDAQGNTVFSPCGSATAPMVVQQVGPAPIQQTFACPANPISRKVPPLC